MSESCVETSAPPEWLSKLESRREQVSRGKLGHESGAGAPCNTCGTGCPGLDLHFWRKLCRNCKCRKDQHECPDDDSGWAQFEILGQTRSKPAYVKIHKIAEKPVKLDWVPPNVAPDLATDYMNQLTSDNVPITGTEAAAKRKQQLEFQVPRHDLDASLCHNLSDKEAEQLRQYVEKIRDDCVGQGNVIRIGVPAKTNVDLINEQKLLQSEIGLSSGKPMKLSYIQEVFAPDGYPIIGTVVKDKMLSYVLSSDLVKGLLHNPAAIKHGSTLVSNNTAMSPDFMQSPNLSDKNKYKLKQMKIDSQGIQSGVHHGEIYDKLFQDLKEKNINCSDNPLLGPLSELRTEYLRSHPFQSDINKFVSDLGNEFIDKYPIQADNYITLVLSSEPQSIVSAQYSSPLQKPLKSADVFNSPLPLKPFASSKKGALMHQETPMRKLNFAGEKKPVDNTLMTLTNYDKILPTILQHPEIMAIIGNDNLPLGTELKINQLPMLKSDWSDNPYLCQSTKQKLANLGLDNEAIRSGVVNGPEYDELFKKLRKKKVRFGQDTILGPMEAFRDEYLTNDTFRDDINDFTLATAHEMYEDVPSGDFMNYTNTNPFLNSVGINPSKSNDSGFDSIPISPNYAMYSGVQENDLVNANFGRFAAIPGIADMNMYPEIRPGIIQNQHTLESVNQGVGNMQITQGSNEEDIPKISILKCKQCQLDILAGEVAVKAERAGKEVAWHPQCFVCHQCKELLADLVYFFHAGNVYCGRDLAVILKIPRCNACDELIFTKEYTAAEGATFHIKHFCCYQCDSPLAGQQYIPDEKTNMPLCLKCYDEFHAEKCQNCKKIIGPAEQGVSWGKVHWHGLCFTCKGINCGKSLIGGRFCVKNDMPFCSPQCVKSIIF